jgi:Common central domain of tyrosinase
MEFASLDQLGRAIDAGWHARVHNTIGGDMRETHSPIDPIFWPWHMWIDEIRSRWASWDAGLIVIPFPWAIENISRLSKWFALAGSLQMQLHFHVTSKAWKLNSTIKQAR